MEKEKNTKKRLFELMKKINPDLNEDMFYDLENLNNNNSYSEWNELKSLFQKNEFSKQDVITILKKIYDNVYQEDKQKLLDLLNFFGYKVK